MIDLSVGGPSWSGFSLKKYSNAKEFRMFMPASLTHYLVPEKHFLVLSAREIQESWHAAQAHKNCAREISDLRKQTDGRMAEENRDLKTEIGRLLSLCDLKQPHFTETETRDFFKAIRLVVTLTEREFREPQRRMAPHTVVNNSPPKMRYR